MTRLRVTLLGAVTLERASGGPVVLPGRKAQALVGYLALQRGQFQQRDKLAALLWPEAPHQRARHNLRQLLLMLRAVLPPSILKEIGETVVGLGTLYAGSHAQSATEHLGFAATMYREMAMRFWLEQAESRIPG